MAEMLTDFVFEAGRRLAATTDYDPVKGDLFGNEHFELWLLILVTVLVIGLGSLAAGAGIGGGGLFVPLFAFVLGVGAKAAVPMSKATILGGAMGNMMSIALARHPDPTNNKPLIDYEASAFMQSGELLGVVFGVLLNLILPEILIIVFLAVLLSFNAYKTLAKGVEKYRIETKKMEAANNTPAKEASAVPPQFDEAKEQAKEVADASPQSVHSFKSEDTEFSNSKKPRPQPDEEGALKDKAPGSGDDSAAAKEKAARLAVVLARDATQFPLWSWGLLVPMTAYTIVYALLKKEFFSVCEPAAYWIWYFSPVPILGLFMFATAWILKGFHKERIAAGYEYRGLGEEHPAYREMIWTDSTLKKFPFIAVLAGVAAGLLGIGGGMVIGPLFIQLDMQPKVGSSSCAFMILWTALSGVVQYAFADKLGWQFIAYGVVVGFISGQLGQRGVDAMLKKSGRPSYVIFLLGSIVLVACMAMTCTGVYKLISSIANGETDGIFKFDTYDFVCHDDHH